MHMKTTLLLRDELIEKAAHLTNIKGKTALVHAGLEALITKHARERLAILGGSDKAAKAPIRRKTPK
jgi:hypothetical protein